MCQVLVSCFLLARQQLQKQQQGRESQGEIHIEAKQPQSRWQHLVKHFGLPIQAWTQTWPPLFGIFTPARPTAISYTFKMSPGIHGGRLAGNQASVPCVGGGWVLPEISPSSTQCCCQGAFPPWGNYGLTKYRTPACLFYYLWAPTSGRASQTGSTEVWKKSTIRENLRETFQDLLFPSPLYREQSPAEVGQGSTSSHHLQAPSVSSEMSGAT